MSDLQITSSFRPTRVAMLLATMTIGLVACAGSGEVEPEPGTTPEPNATAEPDAPEPAAFPPDHYDFESRFNPGESSVAYSGQVQRHALIKALKGFIGGLDDLRYPAGTTPETILTDLQFFYDYKNAGGTGEETLAYSLALPTSQTTYGDLGSPASLHEKMPDQDANWTTGVIGYGDGSLLPSEVINDMFLKLATSIAARADGAVPSDPSGTAIPKPFLTPDGVDYQQLIQKFLDGAVTYSQATDDYLDGDIEGKGILSDNSVAVEGQPYTPLEHAWDEAFGYFGASRNAFLLSDTEIIAEAFDANDDQEIDLMRELNQGHSLNASKRDAAATVATDFSHTALRAFLDGRTVIRDADGPLSAAQMQALVAARDELAGAWESAIAATAVHYINDVLGDMNKFGTSDYLFADHAKHWSELKGFALALQFNPRMSLSATNYSDLMVKIGDAPVLENASESEIADYRTALIDARTILGDSLGFASENLGDNNGIGGW